MKKLISISVALALLTMAVVPGAVAAQDPPGCPASNYTYPTTFAKIPFAIVQSGLELVGLLLEPIGTVVTLPAFLNADLMNTIAGWAGGPLSWTVDMLGWGLSLLATIVGVLNEPLGLDMPWLVDLINTVACSIFTPFACVSGANFTPCPPPYVP